MRRNDEASVSSFPSRSYKFLPPPAATPLVYHDSYYNQQKQFHRKGKDDSHYLQTRQCAKRNSGVIPSTDHGRRDIRDVNWSGRINASAIDINCLIRCQRGITTDVRIGKRFMNGESSRSSEIRYTQADILHFVSPERPGRKSTGQFPAMTQSANASLTRHRTSRILISNIGQA